LGHDVLFPSLFTDFFNVITLNFWATCGKSLLAFHSEQNAWALPIAIHTFHTQAMDLSRAYSARVAFHVLGSCISQMVFA